MIICNFTGGCDKGCAPDQCKVADAQTKAIGHVFLKPALPGAVELPPLLPERYCLMCAKHGHQTHECESTHGTNTAEARELSRLVALAAQGAAAVAADARRWRALCNRMNEGMTPARSEWKLVEVSPMSGEESEIKDVRKAIDAALAQAGKEPA